LNRQKVETRKSKFFKKNKELKLAQFDLKACKDNIQKLQVRLDRLRNSGTNKTNEKDNAKDGSVSASKSNRTTLEGISSVGKKGQRLQSSPTVCWIQYKRS
jgi:hypothetical protein